MDPILFLAIKATLIFSAALLLLWALAKANPRWRMLVCEMAVVSVLLLPAVSLLPIVIPIPLGGTHGDSAAPSGPPLADSTPAASGADTSSFAGAENSHSQSAHGFPDSAQSRSIANSGVNLAFGLWSLYALGAIVLVVRYQVGRIRMRGSIAQLRVPDARTRARFQEIAEEIGLGAIPNLRVADSGSSPFCCGWAGGTVVIPESLAAPEQSDALGLVLRHELHHLANHDLQRSVFMNACAVLLWLHPLVWLLRRSHATATEELGDRAAAGGESGRERYRAMLASLTLELRDARTHPPLALGLFRTPQIVVRLRRLAFAVPHARIPIGVRIGFTCAIAIPVLISVASLQLSAIAADSPERKPNRLLGSLPEGQRAEAKKSIDMGLKALIAAQKKDGSFTGKSDGSSGQETGVTALAGAALLANGGTEKNSATHKAMLRCIDYVLACQDDSGLFKESRDGNNGPLYHHSIATWFLSRVIGQTDADRKNRIGKSLPRAVKILVDAQAVPKVEAVRGGWRYSTNSKDSDLSCTAWAIRALHAAKAAGVKVDAKVFDDALKYILRLQTDDGGFGYTIGGGNGPPSGAPLTAMGLYCLHKAGQGDSAEAGKAAKRLHAVYQNPQKHYEYYGILWGSAAMAQRGGDAAKDYTQWMFKHCAAKQNEDGRWNSGFGDVMGTVFVMLAFAPAD